MDLNATSEIPNFDPNLGTLVSIENQKHLNTTVAVLGSIVAAVLIAGGFYFYSGNLIPSLMIGGAIGGLGVAVSVAAMLSGESGERTFRLYQNGITVEKGSELRTMMFDDLETLEYDFKKVYCNGVYAGDIHEATLTAKADGMIEAEKMHLRSGTKADKKAPLLEYDSLVKYVSESISINMASELATSEKVEWIAGCYIRKDGIEVPVKSGFRSKVQFVPWSQFENQKFHDGLWMLAVDPSGKWRVKLDTSKPNFFPGHYLIQELHGLGSKQTIDSQECASASDSSHSELV